MLRTALTVLQVFSSLAIIALVLIQRGKGADAGAGFGAGASGTVFGARGARTALSRATAVFAAVFMLNSLALAYMGMQSVGAPPTSVLDEAAQTAPADTAPPAPAADSVPTPAQTPAPNDTPPDR
jgi:preprotein translocase subunit SecG